MQIEPTEHILDIMSKDSSSTYIHMHHPRLADFFEDFTRPHTSLYANLAAAAAQQHQHVHHHQPNPSNPGAPTTATAVTYGSSGSLPSGMVPSFLPIEEIYIPAQYQPLNPEDEDDVVPDQHAAFGIARAMDAAGRRGQEPIWRDLGLSELVRGARRNAAGAGGGSTAGLVNGRGGGGPGSAGVGAGSTSSVAPGWRLKQTGALMGGRRTICLR